MSDFKAKLIKNIEVYPCLYDKYHIDYFNRQNKEKAWNIIAFKCRVPVEEVKICWKGLRKRFVCEQRKSSENRTWEHYNSMTFLADHTVLTNSNKEDEDEVEAQMQWDNNDTSSESSYKKPTKSHNSNLKKIKKCSVQLTPQNDINKAHLECVSNLLEKDNKGKSKPIGTLCGSQRNESTEQDSFYKYLESVLNRVNEPKRWKIQFDVLNFAHTLVNNENET